MADTTVTVRQNGTGDYTTIASAETGANTSSGYYKIVIDDSNQYTESVTVSGSSLSTSSNYIWITVSEGNRHDGVAGSGARVKKPTTQSVVFDVYEPYTRFEHLEVIDGYGFQVRGANCLISRCMVGGPSANRNISDIQTGNLFVDNCAFYGATQTAIMSSNGGSLLHIDHCTVQTGSTTANQNYAGIRHIASNSGKETNLYNTILVDTYAYAYSAGATSASASGTTNITDSGSNNTYDGVRANGLNQGSITGWISVSSISDTSSGSTTISVNETSYSTLDYTLTNLTVNPAAGAGTNRIGSEPDARQDFSTDIAGNARTTKAGYIDIGAYQVSAAPAGFKYWDGAAWADSTAVQYYNGSAWVDVTGIQYWNGSAWTDPS